MQQAGTQSATQWAVQTFGAVRLGDQRRTERAVRIAAALAANPAGSVPEQMGSAAATKATYRFLENARSSYEQLMAPHLSQTQALMKQQPQRWLLVQDMTEVEYTGNVEGLGPVGKGKHQRGYLLQSVLAIDPGTRQVLGLAAQEAFLRQPAPAGENAHGRDQRKEKESQVWQRQVERIGAVAGGWTYVSVADRGADIFAFLRAGQRLGQDFLVRAKHDRRVDVRVERGEEPLSAGEQRNGAKRSQKQEPIRHLHAEAESWEARGQQTITLDGNHKRREREAQLLISWGQVRLWPPDGEGGKGEAPMVVTVVRTWEPNPPEGTTALSWLLLSSVPVTQEAEAWERVEWYRCRWIVEDYHQCLKTGTGSEERQLQSYGELRTLLGFLAPLAVRLLQLRATARQTPERLAQEVLPKELVVVVAHLAKVAPERLTCRTCFRRIAQLGGFLGRKGDGEPGWKTLWKGWQHLQVLLEGFHLASQLNSE